MTDPMTLREQVKQICNGFAGRSSHDPQGVVCAEQILGLITEACAKVAEDMERKRHDAVGHPLIPEFTPHIANRIRQLVERQ